ncbi:MAG: ORF6N domain-containing protein [Deltaproteobacteria bacterium]|nr:ORF6N domain-containing protein [Deltaproteobacteria bacterium]MBW2640821.1 ORF6N domain-containing protein [Deltaproteobacteria bacterium]MBW2681240.1 ORF6N domain-containing protein [Deltaproteobacteria bacterium]
MSDREFENLKSQFVTSSWGGMRRSKPYAFTEQGVAMFTPLNRCILLFYWGAITRACPVASANGTGT